MTDKSDTNKIYRLLELPVVYQVNQLIATPTRKLFQKLIERNVPTNTNNRILDIACGLSGYKSFLQGQYVGIDINADYVASAASPSSSYSVMDCTALGFRDESFDIAITVALTHHLSPDQLAMMVREALRVTRKDGTVYILDAILPVSPIRPFKTWWFQMDRGNWPRTLKEMQLLIGQNAHIATHEVATGPLHDVALFQCVRNR